MPYKIEYSERAKKELGKLPKKVIVKLLDKIDELAINPRPANYKQLTNFNLPNNPFKSPLYRIRVGNYRVIYVVEEEKIVVVILKIAHRKDVYE